VTRKREDLRGRLARFQVHPRTSRTGHEVAAKPDDPAARRVEDGR